MSDNPAILQLPANQPEGMTPAETLAMQYVDELVENGLDTGAVTHRQIEKIAVQVITDERTQGHVNVSLPLIAEQFVTEVIRTTKLDTGAMFHREMERRFIDLLKSDQNNFAALTQA